MNWPKIKTALICLFLAIDIFLAGWDIALRRGKSRVSDEVVENTVSLLADRTLTVSPALISRSAPRITTVTAKNPMADEAGFIGKILGTGYIKDGNRFYKPGKEVELSDNSFIIKEQKKIASLSEARAWLSDNGFDLSGTVQTEYMGSYLFRTVYSGFELFKSGVTVTCDGETAVAEGMLLYVESEDSKKEEILNVTSVLPRLVTDGAANCEIIGITPGYMCTAAPGERFSETGAIPVYRILLSDGREFFYEAVQ